MGFEAPKTSLGSMAEPYDMVCVGFGPAALAIAVALHDKRIAARVLFLERQRSFAWHAGMLLPGARMQISFLKDLATLRDPRSKFTFLNYLKSRGRLEAFINLNTFLPLREEFSDYLVWAASHFASQVRYGATVTSISPQGGEDQPIASWVVTAMDTVTHKSLSVMARHVVIAQGGTPKIPHVLSSFHKVVAHSSQYLSQMPLQLRPASGEGWRIAIIGAGQSAAEVFNDLTSRFGKATIRLFFASSALRPSDDSPFVNEIFDPDKVSEFYALSACSKRAVLDWNRGTNYSVVRSDLLERLYEEQYRQRIRNSDEAMWKHRICSSRELRDARLAQDGKLEMDFLIPHTGETIIESGWDFVIAATGYTRDSHESILKPVADMMDLNDEGAMHVSRDYRVRMKPGQVQPNCGIWLQGCCEGSHGLSDTLLSILATRSGEVVSSIFGEVGPHMNGTAIVDGLTNESVNGSRRPVNTVD